MEEKLKIITKSLALQHRRTVPFFILNIIAFPHYGIHALSHSCIHSLQIKFYPPLNYLARLRVELRSIHAVGN